jgi:transcriptional regulator with XRE-family HTH domain
MSKADSTPDYKLPLHTPDDLRQIRKDELALSLEELAEKMNCDPRTIQRYEKGDFPIPQEFIRKLERLRVEDLERRARAVAKGRIDLSKFFIPGLKLIELRPVLRVAGKLFRMFIAVPKEWLPEEESEQPQPSPAPNSGGVGSQRGTPAATPRAEFWVLAGGLALVACLCVGILGVLLVLRNDLQGGVRWARSLRVARDAKVERPATPAPSQKTATTAEEQEPDGVPSEIYYSDGSPEGTGNSGAKAKRSIPAPKKPYSWQKPAPCDTGETEEGGGCYQLTQMHPPCPRYTVENAQRQCLMPIPAEPKKPNTVEPKKIVG